ncbi:MAG: hypothetical protein KC933_05790 [Myxococcales bacterium]|nr:hypothetical protein [Myxococcales bacterium]MCB9651249.1 hypothetical protein [Deltaproteobacteria bacterium]
MATERRSWGPVLRAAAWILAGLFALALWFFPDAIRRWRQSSGPYALMEKGCDPSKSACVARFADGTTVALAVSPEGAPGAVPLTFTVTATKAEAVELQGLDMNMGLLHFPLHEGSRPGEWTATGVLPVCTADRMRWRADVLLEDRAAGFELVSKQP